VAHGKLSFTAMHYTDQELSRVEHPYELRKSKETFLNLDHAQWGVGNASCGPDPLPEYYIPYRPADMSFTIRPYSLLSGDAAENAHKTLIDFETETTSLRPGH
jgi:beta-galactosidase